MTHEPRHLEFSQSIFLVTEEQKVMRFHSHQELYMQDKRLTDFLLGNHGKNGNTNIAESEFHPDEHFWNFQNTEDL